MKSISRLLLVGLILPILTACQGTLPIASEAGSVDYGPQPKDPAAAVKAWALLHLKDPYTADIRMVPGTGAQKGYLRGAPIAGGKITVAGWLVECAINGKNSYGGFEGFKPYRFIVRGEQVVGQIHTGIKWYPEPWLKVGPDGSSL